MSFLKMVTAVFALWNTFWEGKEKIMKNHKITVNDLKESIVFSKEIIGSYGKGEHKTIKIEYDDDKVYYTVHHYDKKVLESTDLEAIVEKYNSIKPDKNKQ